MLSINIERNGANSRLILTMTTIIIHRKRERERASNNWFETLSLGFRERTIMVEIKK